jgi:hypothetical protein
MELSPFEADFKRYGREGFEVYVLESDVSAADACRRESFWIAEYKSTNPEYGYNISRGNDAPQSEIIFALPPNPSKVSPNQLIPKKEE